MKTLLTYLLFILTFFYRSIIAQSNLQLISNYFAYVSTDVVKNGDYLYVIEQNIGITIFDFKNASNPVPLKKLTCLDGIKGIEELVIDGNTGYVNWGDSGIAKIDFTNPTDPILKGLLINNSFQYQNLKIKFPCLYGIAKSNVNDSLYCMALILSAARF